MKVTLKDLLKQKAKTFGIYKVSCDCGYEDEVSRWMHNCPKCHSLIRCWSVKWVRLDDVSKVLADYVVVSKQKLQEIKEKWKGLGESELAVNEAIKEILEAERNES